MTIQIEINCEDERELFLHLAVIRQQIKKEIKKQKESLDNLAVLKDSNCYGDHVVTIIPE